MRLLISFNLHNIFANLVTHSTDIYDELRDTLFHDSAVAGEAAGYAIGLVMLGTGSQKALDEMLQYAHETQHEKIIRGLAVGISLLMYGKQEEADQCIDTLMTDKVGQQYMVASRNDVS